KVVDDAIDQAQRDDHPGIVGICLTEVEQVVKQASGETEANPDLQQVTDNQGETGQQGMNHEEDRGYENESELDGFGDPGQERAEGGGEQNSGSHFGKVRSANHSQGGSRQAEHHHRE